MIAVNEIRIGNLVNELQGNYDSDNDCFNFNDEDKIETVVNIDVLKRIIVPKEYEVFEPIPLTAEILEQRCGFVWKDGFAIKGRLSIKNTPPKFQVYGGDQALIDIKYIHQLQNLYFVLTGLELEIKL